MAKKQITVTSHGPGYKSSIPITGEFITRQRVAAILRGVALVNGRVSFGIDVGAILNPSGTSEISPALQQQIVAAFRERFGPGCPSRTNFVQSVVRQRLTRI